MYWILMAFVRLWVQIPLVSKIQFTFYYVLSNVYNRSILMCGPFGKGQGGGTRSIRSTERLAQDRSAQLKLLLYSGAYSSVNASQFIFYTLYIWRSARNKFGSHPSTVADDMQLEKRKIPGFGLKNTEIQVYQRKEQKIFLFQLGFYSNTIQKHHIKVWRQSHKNVERCECMKGFGSWD